MNTFTKSKNQHPSSHFFDLSHLFYYGGAMILLAAFIWLLGLEWKRFGGGGILAISLAYICLFLLIGNFLWGKKNLKIPGGLFITMAVCIIPFAVCGFEEMTGWGTTDETGSYHNVLSWIQGGRFLMELATIVGGCVALYFFRFPFLTVPIYFSLWFVLMDTTPLLLNPKERGLAEYLWVNVIFGLGILSGAYLMDRRTDVDFSFWGYLCGLLVLHYSLSLLCLGTETEWKRFVYFLIHVGFILLSILLQRTVFLGCGALGSFNYLTALASKYFSHSILSLLVLSLIGILLVFLGNFYHKNHLKMEQALIKSLPDQLKKWLPRSR